MKTTFDQIKSRIVQLAVLALPIIVAVALFLSQPGTALAINMVNR